MSRRAERHPIFHILNYRGQVRNDDSVSPVDFIFSD